MFPGHARLAIRRDQLNLLCELALGLLQLFPVQGSEPFLAVGNRLFPGQLPLLYRVVLHLAHDVLHALRHGTQLAAMPRCHLLDGGSQ